MRTLSDVGHGRNMSPEPSRPVTRKCVVCEAKFQPARSDKRYCSGACRQRAQRARDNRDRLDREIEAARLHYWSLVRLKAVVGGASESQVLTGEAQFVDVEGTVFIGDKLVGHTTPHREGWAAWGLEAAPAPFRPPPDKPS